MRTTLLSEYKDTLNLPHTDFPMRPSTQVQDPLQIEQWSRAGVYTAAMQLHTGAKSFILHDGPPYANGSIHLGHAYNKVLKDIVTKAYRMAGYHVPVKPGWDCHGLPIEHKVLQEIAERDPISIKKACRAYAQKWIEIQREEFKRLGIIMDWEHPYITMSKEYEGDTLRAFACLVDRGFIARKLKTVAWCSSCETTLASAEIEYHERKDPSIYVAFLLVGEGTGELTSLLVWTTTPWTLPLNRAVSVKPNASYACVRYNNRLYIVGANCVPELRILLKNDLLVESTITGELLVGRQVQHPFIADHIVPIIADEQVETSSGTACVHVAPGCGPSDYELAVKQGIEIYSPLTSDGKYSAEIIPAELAGISIQDGQGWVIRELEANGTLVHKGSIRHSYPHCWRCRRGLMFRATKQWFFDLQHATIQEAALRAIDTITFVPVQGAQFMRATVGSRWEWCLSRQRMWGVPIPALICQICDMPYLRGDFVRDVADHVTRQGIEYWDLVDADVVGKNISCAACGATLWRRETDILDVWFDSGVSHYVVLQGKDGLVFPADLYLEGVDQYRGWYQSSLLTSMAIEERAPMRAIMSHGFTVDEQGQKMSKSLGNVVTPQQIIERLGTDGLRLWVASSGRDGDIVVSSALLTNIEQVYRKIRNTCRFLLQNTADFNAGGDPAAIRYLCLMDRCALTDFVLFYDRMRDAYQDGDFTAVFHGLADYCTTALSAVYLDVLKDRLYVEAKNGHQRRSAQLVLHIMLDSLTRLLAPILSFTAEQIASYYQHEWQGSVHLQQFADLSAYGSRWTGMVRHDESYAAHYITLHDFWNRALEIRSAVMKLIEPQRAAGIISHPLQAQVTLCIAPEYSGYLALQKGCEILGSDMGGGTSPDAVKRYEALLAELCVVSRCDTVESSHGLMEIMKGISGRVLHAPGVKCPRCWKWGISSYEDGLCDRCGSVVTEYMKLKRL